MNLPTVHNLLAIAVSFVRSFATSNQSYMHHFPYLRSAFIVALSFLLVTYNAVAQNTKEGSVKGKVMNAVTSAPVADISVTIPDQKLQTTTGGDGAFSIPNVPSGTHTVVISGANIKSDTLSVTVNGETDMGDVKVFPADNIDQTDIPSITLEENSSQGDDENSSTASQGSSSFYVGNDDPFLYTAAVIFGPYRFKPRGYDNSDVHINGVSLQDLETGFAPFGLIGGLNDVMRDRTVTYGLRPAEYSFGSVKGSTYINTNAANIRKGTSLSYQLSNGRSRNRIMATYASGVSRKGWAYAFSGSRRWAKEGYMPGAFYDAYSFYGSVSKLFKKGQFNLTAFGAPSRYGRSTAEMDEVFDLAGTNVYNAGWGYQNGEKRTSKFNTIFQPMVIANYTYHPSDRTRWNTAVGYEFGTYKRSDIDFYNAPNPNPTYYKKLPSYFIEGVREPSQRAYDALVNKYRANPAAMQLQWDNMYQSNYSCINTINDVNGIAGNNVTGRRSLYVLRDEVDDMRKMSFNSVVTHTVNKHISVDGGVDVVYQKDEYYKELTDLLGGDFFVNYNQFAALKNPGNSTYVQHDLNKPNRTVKEGEKYGYNYYLNAFSAKLWAQGGFTFNHFDFFAAAEGGTISFSREGLMRNGLFPDNSYGKSATHNLTTYKVKGGVTYKINAKHGLYAHAGYFVDAPKIDNIYISSKTRDYTVGNVKTYTTMSFEAGYVMRTSIVNARVTGYVNDVTGNTMIKRYWNDDPDYQSFVNYVMEDVNTRSIGTEVAASVKVLPSLTVSAIAAVGQSFYTNRPLVTIYQDNVPGNTGVAREVYIKNYYLGVGPQSIYSLAFKYAPGHNWHANLDLNYMDRNYVEINPDRRTYLATQMITPGSAQWNAILEQEKLPAAFVANVSVGKSFDANRFYKKFSSRSKLNVNLGVNNLLNNKDIKISGFEQLRFDYNNQNAEKFRNRYLYAFGLNFYLTISLRF